nr:MAG TPA: major tail protein [Caudoviricetes sp.]
MKYTKIPTDTFKNLQLNAGVLLKSFDVDTQTLAADSIVGATSGGVSFTAVPSFTDFGEDIDNCPKNMKEMKKLDSWEAKMSGTFASVSKSLAKTLVGAADLSGSKITPRNDLAAADFADLWWVGDYSEVNEDGTSTGKAGFIAIHLLNSLSTGGFSIQSSDKGKGQFEFEFTGHYSMEDQDKVPFEVYIQEGTAA